jgi:hypothetical protein
MNVVSTGSNVPGPFTPQSPNLPSWSLANALKTGPPQRVTWRTSTGCPASTNSWAAATEPDTGHASRGVEWEDDAFDQVPAIGDKIFEPLRDGVVDVCEVVERYIHFDHQNDDVWHLMLKRVDIAPDRLEALLLVDVVEEVIEKVEHTDGGGARLRERHLNHVRITWRNSHPEALADESAFAVPAHPRQSAKNRTAIRTI